MLIFFDYLKEKYPGVPVVSYVNTSADVKADERIELLNGKSEGFLLLLQGVPIGEPVVQHGPFVMNTQEEIRETMREYGKTQFGGWPWPRTDMVHGKEAVRFARFDNGDEIIKD